MEVTIGVTTQLDELAAQIAAASAAMQEATQDAGKYEKILSGLEQATEELAKGQAELEESIKKQGDAYQYVSKGQEQFDAAIKRGMDNAFQMTSRVDRLAGAITTMGDATTRVTSVNNLSEQSIERLNRVAGTYAITLQQTGDNQSYLLNQWKRSLTPAEKVAQQLAEVVSFATDAERETAAYQLTVQRLSEKLDMLTEKEIASTQAGKNRTATLREIIQEQTEAIQSTQMLTTMYAAQKQKLDAVETSMQALGIPGANLVARGKQLADAFETASERMSTGQQTAFKIGLAFGAVGSAAIVATTALVGTGAAIVGIVSKADEWNAELVKIGEGLKGVEAVDLGTAAASIDAVGMSAKSVGVAIAETFGPVVKAGAVQLTALGLAATDGWRAMWAGKDVIDTISTWVGQKLVGSLTFGIKAMMGLAGGVAELGKALRLPGAVEASDALDRFAAQLQDIEDDHVAGVSAALKMMGRDAIAPLTTATEGYLERAEKMVGSLAKQKAAAKGAADTIKAELIPAMREHTTVIGEVEQALTPVMSLYDNIAAAQTYDITPFSESVQAAEAAAEGTRQAMQDSLTAISGGVGAAVAFGNALSQAVTGMDLVSLFEAEGPDAGRALVDGMVSALKDAPQMVASIGDAFVGGLEALADNADLIADLGIGVVQSIVDAIPDIAQALPEVAVALIEALVPQIPSLVAEIIALGPEIGAAIGVGIAQMVLEALGMDRQAAKLGDSFDQQQERSRDFRRNGMSGDEMSLTLERLNTTMQRQGEAMDSLRDALAWMLGKLGGKNVAKRL